MNEKEFSIEDILKNALGNEYGVPADITIDDSDCPAAHNYAEFIASSAGLDIKPFASQLEIGTKFFSEWCPRCTDTEFFDKNGPGRLSVPVRASYTQFIDKVALLNYGTCPKCGVKRSELLRTGELKLYNEMVGVAGQRSSKSVLSAMHAAYVTHFYLKLQNPTALLGLQKASFLHGTFVALTYDQAKANVWEPYYDYISTSPWFVKYHSILDAYQTRDEELYKIKDTFIMYRHARLLCYPAGPNKKTLRGYTRFMAVLDELGWFGSDAESKDKVKMGADEVYIALERSLLTVRAAGNRLQERGMLVPPTGYFMNISSPSDPNDKIMSLLRDSRASNTMFGFREPTWNMNPNITRKDLSSEFKKNPVAAARDYGANPTRGEHLFIDRLSTITQCFGKYSNRVHITHKLRRHNDGSLSRYAVPKFIFESASPSVLAIDAGYSNNSFGFAVIRLNGDKLNVDALGEVQPVPSKLNYSLIYKELLRVIIDKMNVVAIAADRWQSLKILHDAESDFPKIKYAKQYSLKLTDMVFVRDLMEEKMITIPRPDLNKKQTFNYDAATYPQCFAQSPIAHAVLQMSTVREIAGKVMKGLNLTDDIWRAMALGIYISKLPEIIKLLKDPIVKSYSQDSLGTVGGKSFGIGNCNTGAASKLGVSGGISSATGKSNINY